MSSSAQKAKSPTARLSTCGYDVDGRRVTFPDSKTVSYYYGDAGRRTRLLYGNSSYTSYLLTLISRRSNAAAPAVTPAVEHTSRT